MYAHARDVMCDRYVVHSVPLGVRRGGDPFMSACVVGVYSLLMSTVCTWSTAGVAGGVGGAERKKARNEGKKKEMKEGKKERRKKMQ